VSLALAVVCAQGASLDFGVALAADVKTEAAAGARPKDMLSKLVGRWVLTGVIAGERTVHDVEATWALQQTYVRLEEVSREKGANGAPAYEATIFIGWAKDHYFCIWLDNTEVASGDVTCSAADTPDAIPLEFRDGKGALIFDNTFTYRSADDSWEWRMVNVRDGAKETFGIVTLRRR
jgi:hypothetical protein